MLGIPLGMLTWTVEVRSLWIARSVDISVNAATVELSYLAKQYLKLDTEE